MSFTDNLSAGTYSVYMCANDGSTVMAQAEFIVGATASAAFWASTNAIKVGGEVSFSNHSSTLLCVYSHTCFLAYSLITRHFVTYHFGRKATFCLLVISPS